MEKIVFENAPSTNTPINANNLNQLQANVEDAIKKSLAKVGLSGDETLAANTYTKIKFNTSIHMDDGFELTSDGGIKIINPNITKCIVKSQLRYVSAGNIYIAIRFNDNDTNDSVSLKNDAPAFTLIDDVSFFDVKQNDVIYVYGYSSASNIVRGGGDPPIWSRFEVIGF